MAFKMNKPSIIQGTAGHRSATETHMKMSAFNDGTSEDDPPHPEHHQSRGDVKQGEKEIFAPNEAGINRREQKRGNSGTTLSGGHGSSGKNENSEFVEPTRTAADESGGGSFDNVNVLPEAEVVAPTREEGKNQGKKDWKKEGGGKDQFKAAVEAWKAGGKEGKRPKRKDFKTN